MDSMDESVTDLLRRLSLASDEEKAQMISHIQPILQLSPSRSALKEALEKADLSVVLCLLHSSHPETVASSCKILRNIFEIIDAQQFLHKYWHSLDSYLRHPDPEVKILMLGVLRMTDFSDKMSVLQAVLDAFFDESTDVSGKASHCLLALSDRTQGGCLSATPIWPRMMDSLDTKEAVMRMRVYHFVLELMALRPLEHQTLDLIVRRLALEAQDQTDPLSQLNALHILTQLTDTRGGLEYLQRSDLLSNMDQQLKQVVSLPFADLLLPGWITLLGHVCRHQPSHWTNRFPHFAHTLADMMSHSDPSRQVLAWDTLAHIAATLTGRAEVLGLIEAHAVSLKELLMLSSESNRVRVWSSLADMLKPEPSANLHQNSSWSEQLLQLLGGQALIKCVCDAVKMPVVELSCAALNILIQASHYEWMVPMIKQQPAFIETLLSRSYNSDKTCKELQWQLLHSLTTVPAAENLWGSPLWLRINQYVTQGPFFVPSEPKVAIEGDD